MYKKYIYIHNKRLPIANLCALINENIPATAGALAEVPDDDDVYLYKLQREGVTKSILYTLPYRPKYQ
jgi:hypothetical protein